MHCQVSRKIVYESEEMAIEALIQNHIRNFYNQDRGPVNVYICDHCGCWHFTSKGPASEVLQSPEVKDRIRKERLGGHWERKLL